MVGELASSLIKWKSLPADRRDKTFWIAFDEFLAPSLLPEFSLASSEFSSLPFTARNVGETIPLIPNDVVSAANDLRSFYDTVSLWNPLALSARLDIPRKNVLEQLLLAKEYGLVSIVFVVLCSSCGCDVLHAKSVKDIAFCSTYHQTNVVQCPFCTECTKVTTLSQVAVYFRELKPRPLFIRRHHRLCYSKEAKKRKLETYFCPPGASFAFEMKLPEGDYLLIASGAGLVVKLHVKTGAEDVATSRKPYPLKLFFEKLCSSSQTPNGFAGVFTTGTDRPSIEVEHGKLLFCVHNDTPHGGYFDVFVAFDERLDLLSSQPLLVETVPQVLHCASRGFRSPLFHLFIPSPPGALTAGVYVRHQFALSPENCEISPEYGADTVINTIREVHRYSLEDHNGLLLSVSSDGSIFESSFLSLTAALSSCLCFAQRIVIRLGKKFACCLTCSITEGGMYMASFKGQYNDDENVLSSYPDVHIMGSALRAAINPPIKEQITIKDLSIEDKLNDLSDADVSATLSTPQTFCFELRSVSETMNGICLRKDVEDKMIYHYLSFIEEHVQGAEVKLEEHALVVEVPLATLNAMVNLPAMLDSVMYTKNVSGPFG